VVFSPDGKRIFTTGFDASLSCFKLRYSAAVSHMQTMKHMIGMVE